MATRRGALLEAGHGPIEADTGLLQDPPLTARTLSRPEAAAAHAAVVQAAAAHAAVTQAAAAHAAAAGTRREGAPAVAVTAGAPSEPGGGDQTWPAFSSAVQQVSTSRRVTTYGSTLAFGRRSSM